MASDLTVVADKRFVSTDKEKSENSFDDSDLWELEGGDNVETNIVNPRPVIAYPC